MSAGPNTDALRLARALVRSAPALGLLELERAELSMHTWECWRLGLLVLAVPGVSSSSASVWLLAAVPANLRARVGELEPVLRALRAPPVTLPLVSAEETPAGEGLFYAWRPREARLRHAPTAPGQPCTEQQRELLRSTLEARFAALTQARLDAATKPLSRPLDTFDPAIVEPDFALYEPPPLPPPAFSSFFGGAVALTSDQPPTQPASSVRPLPAREGDEASPARSSSPRPPLALSLLLLAALGTGSDPGPNER